MEPKVVLVCMNVDCRENGSEAVLAELTRKQNAQGLRSVEIREYLCFSACTKGPNIVCVDDRVWYCGVQPRDVDEILDSLQSGTTVERLTENNDSITKSLIMSILEAGLLPGDVL